PERLFVAINENLDVRRRIYRLPAWQTQMADVGRACGASANFAGSGGAIVGTCADEAMFERLQSALGAIDCRVLRIPNPEPRIPNPESLVPSPHPADRRPPSPRLPA